MESFYAKLGAVYHFIRHSPVLTLILALDIVAIGFSGWLIANPVRIVREVKFEQVVEGWVKWVFSPDGALLVGLLHTDYISDPVYPLYLRSVRDGNELRSPAFDFRQESPFIYPRLAAVCPTNSLVAVVDDLPLKKPNSFSHYNAEIDRISLLSVSDGRLLRQWQANHQRKSEVTQIAFTPSGELVVATEDEVVFWSVPEGRRMWTLPSTHRVGAFALSHCGRLLAVSYSNHTIVVWQLPERRQVRVLEGRLGLALRLVFSPDNNTLAAVYSDGTVSSWNTAQGKILATVKCDYSVAEASISPDGRFLLVSNDSTFQLHRLPDLKRVYVRKMKGFNIFASAFTPDNQLLIVGTFYAPKEPPDPPNPRSVVQRLRDQLNRMTQRGTPEELWGRPCYTWGYMRFSLFQMRI